VLVNLRGRMQARTPLVLVACIRLRRGVCLRVVRTCILPRPLMTGESAANDWRVNHEQVPGHSMCIRTTLTNPMILLSLTGTDPFAR
jgi:hypothetical protein